MARKTALPHFSRVSFFRCRDQELVHALAATIRESVGGKSGVKISAAHLAIVTWSDLAIDVPNGGFTQYFFNHREVDGISALCKLLTSLKLPKIVTLLREAVAIYKKYKRCFNVENPFDGLFGSIKEFEKLDRRFFNVGIMKAHSAMDGWIRGHIDELAIGDDGAAIDPGFTGTVEIQRPDGSVAELLEVKKGKPNGAYKEFFDDGSVRDAKFYKAGKESGDYWPSGEVKKKESRSGGQKVIEFFYPSGKLQKRMVLDKKGMHVEPIRLYHENGQLAEELTKREDKKRGPWLKFFEDGSPRLQAQYKGDEERIIHNAWDEQRVQVVKDGKGVFNDDSPSIDWEYDVFFENGWPKVIEVEGGIEHGKTTTYRDGVVWGIASFVRGKLHGESITYWDNGKVRMVQKFDRGKQAGEPQEFPRVDQPKPVVLLFVEANEQLYSAWRHIAVDEYPKAENADEIQAGLRPPQFLLDVYERNLAGKIKDDYEDWSTFNDGITYFLSVNANGEVEEVRANGSSVYSGGDWETYKPLLKQLRFSPGRIRGRAVECGVIVRVEHTFAEGAKVKQ